MERYGGGQIAVVDYDPAWPAMFDHERTAIARTLGDLVVAIEHIGSTSVPGLAAKPIIDLLVGVTSLEAARTRAAEPLEALGYTLITSYGAWLPDELFFRKGLPWTHHAHVMAPGTGRWSEFLAFRDHLRAHPDAAAAYAAEKRRLAAAHGDDIAGYRFGKTAFVVTAFERMGMRSPLRPKA
jgi:GrpB-like predicted nucleotidyltransferase (UPF0157 family)